MKRREFLSHTAGLASVLAASVSTAQTRPCPPELEGQPVNCPDDEPPLDGPPTWFLNAADEQWFAVPVTNTGQSIGMTSGMFSNFTGAGFDQGRLEFVKTAAGGHVIDWRNGTYVLQLNRESPAWVLLVEDSLLADRTEGSGGKQGNIGNQSYRDGTPRAVHNWNSGCFPVGNTIWLPAMTGQYTFGAFGSQVWGLNRAALTNPPVAAANAPWRHYGHGIPEAYGGLGGGQHLLEAASSAYDYDTGLIWTHSQFSQSGAYPFWSIDTARGSINQHPSFGGQFPGAGATTRRGSSFIVDGYWILVCPIGGRTLVLDLSNPTSGGIKEIKADGSPSYNSLETAGVGYHAASRTAYFYRPSLGKTLVTLRVPSDPWNGTYAWGSETPGGATPSGLSGNYSHFVIINDMGNGQPALFHGGGRTGRPYMYKLPMT